MSHGYTTYRLRLNGRFAVITPYTNDNGRTHYRVDVDGTVIGAADTFAKALALATALWRGLLQGV